MIWLTNIWIINDDWWINIDLEWLINYLKSNIKNGLKHMNNYLEFRTGTNKLYGIIMIIELIYYSYIECYT